MDLKKEIADRASIFNNELDTFLNIEQPENLYEASRHLPMAGGKRLRPVLTMLCCEAVGGKAIEALPFALAVEIIHNFTLVHDDIMDKSTLRRNLQTVHLKYSEPTAILAGDLLFVKAFEALEKYPSDILLFRKLNNHLIQSVIEVCEGQQLDMNFENRLIVPESEYIEMIRKKTSALFRISADGGALIGGGSKEVVKALNSYGTSLGLAFQIRDDYLDMSSTAKTLGKDIGNDIRNGKKTLIAVHALSHCKGDAEPILRTIFGNAKAKKKDVECVYDLFKQCGSIDYAAKKAEAYSKKAIQELDTLEDSKAKNILHELALYSMTREK
jgi:geranylgeranyl diphosphate synthase, type I